MKKAIADFRKEIDQLDQQIVELLDKRAELAIRIGKAKKQTGAAFSYAPEREEAVLSNLTKGRRGGKFPARALNAVFAEVVSACRNIHVQDKIAVLGERYGWVHDAAMLHFGLSGHLTTMETQEELLEMLSCQDTALGFLAMTQTSSDLRQILEAFLNRNLHIISEFDYVQKFALVSRHTAELSEITEIFVTRELLKLLRNWISSLPFPVTINICRSCEEVLENTVESNPCAGLLPERVATGLELTRIHTGLQPVTPVPYRCFVVAPEPFPANGTSRRCSALCGLTDKTRGLECLLASLTSRGLKLQGIEMFPFHHKAWDELFLIDFEAPAGKSELKKIYADMEAGCALFRPIGEYPVFT